MKLLYRITSLENLVSILYRHQDRFVRPIDCWEDTFEGYALHLLDTDEGSLSVIRELYNGICKKDYELTVRNYAKLQRARYTCYAQSWSTVKDSDAMWRIYSYGKKSVQLLSDREAMFNLIEQNSQTLGKIGKRLGEVKYDLNDNDLGSSLVQVLYPKAKVDESFFHKRSAFKHEKEQRIVLQLVERYSVMTEFITKAILNNIKHEENLSIEERILNAQKRLGNVRREVLYPWAFPKELLVEIPIPKDYIKGVRVHPQAEKWYEDLIKDICDQSSVEFLGKSDLYRKAL